jgi:hypothetical protein
MIKTLLPLTLIMKLENTLLHSTVLKTVVTETSLPNTESTLNHLIFTIVPMKKSALSLNQDISILEIWIMKVLMKNSPIMSKILSKMPTTKKMITVLLLNQHYQPDIEICVQLKKPNISFGNSISTSMTTKPEVILLISVSISVKDTDISSTEITFQPTEMIGGGIMIGPTPMFSI